MGILARISAATPTFPGSRNGGRMFLGWGDNYFGGAMPFRLPNEQDYRRTVGDGSGTSLITAATNWMARELVGPTPILKQYVPGDDQHEGVARVIRMHPVIDLIDQPNPYYDGATMRMACSLSWLIDGNVYRWKIRSGSGRVVQIWYLPHWCVEPIGETKFIDYYRYSFQGEEIDRIDPADIEHLRFGLDPRNPRKGLSPIRGVLRELYTDEEAARFSAAIMHNVAFPGAVVIPGEKVQISKKEDRDEIRDTFDSRFGGEGRGRTIVMSANADVKFLQWSPKELELSQFRDVPEERVSSVLGIPAAVLGYGTGMEDVKVGATMEHLQVMAWEQGPIPFLTMLARNDRMQLLPEFMPESERSRTLVDYDLGSIGALSPLRAKQAEIEATLVRAGIKTADESRSFFGLPPVGGADGGFKSSPGVGGAAPAAATGAQESPHESLDHENAEDGLTPREREVALLAARGYANKHIASTLAITERSVERHLSNAKTKLGVESRAELGAWASDAEPKPHEDETSRALAATASAVLELAKSVASQKPPDIHVSPITRVDHGLAPDAQAELGRALTSVAVGIREDNANSTKAIVAASRDLRRAADAVVDRPPAREVREVVKDVARDENRHIQRVTETLVYENEDRDEVLQRLGRRQRKG